MNEDNQEIEINLDDENENIDVNEENFIYVNIPEETIEEMQEDIEELKTDIQGKVDKVAGKGLSTEDYTTAEKNKLANLENYDDTEVKADIQENTDNIQALETKHDTEVAELQSQIEELQAENQALEDQIPTAPATGSDITLSDSADKLKFKKIVPGGKSEQETSKMIYVCDGTETGTYYFTYDSINYQFTMPTVAEGDILVFDTSTLVLSLDSTTITTEAGTSGTQLTFKSTPNSDYECPIQNVTGNVEVKVESKNLFTGWIIGSRFNSNTGELEISTNYSRSDYIKANLNEEYYFSNIPDTDNSYLLAYDKDKNFVARTGSTKRNSVLVRKAIFNTTGTTGTGDLDSIEYIAIVYSNTNVSNNTQLEEGSTATDFIEHEEQTAIFPLSEGQILHLGDTIEDKIVQKRKTLVIDITKFSTTVLSNGILMLTNIRSQIGYYKNINGLCSHFINANNEAITDNTTAITTLPDGCYNFRNGTGDSGKDRIYFRNTSFETLQDWVNFFNNNNVVLEFTLKEPIEIEFTEAQATAKAQIDKLYSYKGTTYITSNANLDVTYRKDLETIIDNLSNAIVAQGGI